MPKTIPITEARKRMGPLFSEVISEHRPALIRRREQVGLLVGADDAASLLAPYEFHTRVFLDEGTVSLWVPELGMYGRAASYEDAAEDLVEEVRYYIDEYWGEIDRYRQAPNRASHFPYLVRAYLADQQGRLLDLLLAEPSDEGAPSDRREDALAPA